MVHGHVEDLQLERAGYGLFGGILTLHDIEQLFAHAAISPLYCISTTDDQEKKKPANVR